MTTNTKCGARRRLVPWLGMLALLVAVTAFAGNAWAGWSTPISPMPPLDDPGDMGEPTTPSHPPVDHQLCFEYHIQNLDDCLSLFCRTKSFFWIEWQSCSDAYYACTADANLVFQCCVKPWSCEQPL